MACTINTGAVSGIACFSVSDSGLTPLSNGLIPIPIAQTSTPPTGPPNTASDIVFNPSSTALFVTVKGDGTNPGFIYAFPITNGKLSSTPVISRPSELLVDFGISFIDDSHAVVADPAYGASMVEISYPSLEPSVSQKVAIAGQKAVCWTAFSDRFETAFIFDGGKPNVTALDPVTGAVKYTITGPADGVGGFDGVVAGSYLYVLLGKAGIAVYNLMGSVGNGKVPMLWQSLDLSALGSRQGWQGLAVY
jgi:hypothetical protein